MRVDSLSEYPGKTFVDEGPLMKVLYDRLVKADMWVTHNGKRFDIPFLQAKMIEYGLGPLPPIAHVDTYFLARYKFKLHSSSLKSVESWMAAFKKLSGHKTELKPANWNLATAGDKKALKYVIDHCKEDVLVLKDAYLMLRSLSQSHPRLYPYPDCPVCGGKMTMGRTRPQKKGRVAIYHCEGECGKYETRTLTKKELEALNG